MQIDAPRRFLASEPGHEAPLGFEVAQDSALYRRPVLEKTLDDEFTTFTLDAPQVLRGLVDELV